MKAAVRAPAWSVYFVRVSAFRSDGISAEIDFEAVGYPPSTKRVVFGK